MIYDITLKIGYEYPSAVKDARHILRVRPLEGHGQSVISHTLTVSPRPDEMARDSDFFGNAVDHVLLYRAHETLDVEMRARVKVEATAPDLSKTPTLAEIAKAALDTRDSGALSPMHFLGDSRLAERSPPAAAYLKAALAKEAPEALNAGFGEAALILTKHIRTTFVYAPGTTSIDTSIDEILRKRRGVCQDFAHLLIGGLRGMGVPAAYVSGFLRTDPPPGRPRLAGADAMHAWVTIWLGPETGWVAFDPTNGILATRDHMLVGIGRDYADVSPIGGVVITSGSQKTYHSVDVVPVEA